MERDSDTVQFSLGELICAFRRHKLIALAVFVVIAVGSVAVAVLKKPAYTVSSTILLQFSREAQSAAPDLGPTSTPVLLRSSALIKNTLGNIKARLGDLTQYPLMNSPALLGRSLVIRPDKSPSGPVKISFSSPDPELSTAVLECYIDALKTYSEERENSAIASTVNRTIQEKTETINELKERMQQISPEFLAVSTKMADVYDKLLANPAKDPTGKTESLEILRNLSMSLNPQVIKVFSARDAPELLMKYDATTNLMSNLMSRVTALEIEQQALGNFKNKNWQNVLSIPEEPSVLPGQSRSRLLILMAGLIMAAVMSILAVLVAEKLSGNREMQP
jgi:uncharacterized protein involved in exopolysaccharide biosynthesis